MTRISLAVLSVSRIYGPRLLELFDFDFLPFTSCVNRTQLATLEARHWTASILSIASRQNSKANIVDSVGASGTDSF